MTSLEIAIQIAKAIYQLNPDRIEAIPPVLDWRGIYRIHEANGQTWLLRMLRLPNGQAVLTQTGELLLWLEQKNYPSPRLRRTARHQIVGVLDGWASLLLSYVDGSVLTFTSPDFSKLGFTLGKLHSIHLPLTFPLRQSRCDPEWLQENTARQLEEGYERGSTSLQTLILALRQSLNPLFHENDDLTLTHGDCWYNNAIQVSRQQVVLVDWDAAGVGMPILDMGYLLLTSHYDLDNPLHMTPDAEKIKAILRGYQLAYHLPENAQHLLKSAVQFPLAFHLGNYLNDHSDVDVHAFELEKMQARFEATHEIARLALSYL